METLQDVMNNEYFELVLDKVQNIMASKDLELNSQSSVMKVLRIAMECIETINTENRVGTSKKDTVLKVLLFIVNESKCSDEKKVLLRELVEDGTLETTMEFIIDASKGKLVLNKKTKRKLFSCLGSCLLTMSQSSRHTTPSVK